MPFKSEDKEKTTTLLRFHLFLHLSPLTEPSSPHLHGPLISYPLTPLPTSSLHAMTMPMPMPMPISFLHIKPISGFFSTPHATGAYSSRDTAVNFGGMRCFPFLLGEEL